jgi:hypothetical protein
MISDRMLARTIVVLAFTALVGFVAPLYAQADRIWIGKRVVPKASGFAFRDADQVAGHRFTAALIYRVGLVVGPRIWHLAENERLIAARLPARPCRSIRLSPSSRTGSPPIPVTRMRMSCGPRLGTISTRVTRPSSTSTRPSGSIHSSRQRTIGAELADG